MELLRNMLAVRELQEVSNFLEKTIEEQFLSYFLYEFKVEELKKSVEDLQEKRDLMQNLVDDEYQNGKNPTPYVLKWLDDANCIISKNDEFWQDGTLPYTICSKGYLPKPGMRFRLAKKAYRLAGQVDDLRKTSFAGEVSSGPRPMSIDFLSSIVNFEIFDSRKQVTENIIKALKDDTIKMVGVYGTGGVGKTTLVKEVASRARRDELFDWVIFAAVTRNPEIKQIQGQLADQLGERLHEETETGRASHLRDIFKKERKNTLVILDDLWDELDLNKLGIPVNDVKLALNSAGQEEGTSVGGQATSDSKLLKILLTSRSKEVVFDKMLVKENSGFPIHVLENQEAEALFKKIVGNKGPEFGPLAAEISNKCGGLPIAIITTGKTLRTKSYSEWKETLNQIEQ